MLGISDWRLEIHLWISGITDEQADVILGQDTYTDELIIYFQWQLGYIATIDNFVNAETLLLSLDGF